MENQQKRILIADDEPLFGRTTTELLRRAGYDVTWVADGNQAIDQLKSSHFDLLIADLNMPGNYQLELLNEGRLHFPATPLIVVTGRPSLPSAIESIRLGIHDYLLKPVEIAALIHSIERALPKSNSNHSHSTTLDAIVGRSPAMLKLKNMVFKSAKSNANILIEGESGTGKELLARAIHELSPRSSGPFVTIDCSALPEHLIESALFGHLKGAFTGANHDRQGLLQTADGGTVFLDEIGEMPLSLQPKLLRAIQFGRFLPVGSNREVNVNVRVVAATNRNLKTEVARAQFREDLYYRLAVLQLQIPPLRDRSEDIEELSCSILADLAEKYGHAQKYLTQDAIDRLKQYRWPGNVRELQNIMEYCACMAESQRIDETKLPDFIKSIVGIESDWSKIPAKVNNQFDLPEFKMHRELLLETERANLSKIISSHSGNLSRAAKAIGMTRQGLYKAMKRCQLDPADFRKL